MTSTLVQDPLAVDLSTLRASLLTTPQEWIDGAPPVALYARISQDDEKLGLGVRRQLLDEAELARARGANIVAVLVDNDLSAYKDKPRPDYLEALRLIRQDEIKFVVVYQASRFIRKRRDRLDVMELFMKHAGVWVVRGSDLDMSTAYSRGVIGMLGEVDTMESEIKAERVRDNIAYRNLAWLIKDDDEDGVRAAETKVLDLERELNEAAEDRAAKLITREQMLTLTAHLIPQLERAKEEQRRLHRSVNIENVKEFAGPQAQKNWAVRSVAQRRVLLEELRVKVIINKGRRGRGFDRNSIGITINGIPY